MKVFVLRRIKMRQCARISSSCNTKSFVGCQWC